MSGKTLTLLAILAFVTLIAGSFVWFIVSWDRDVEEQVTWIMQAREVMA